MTLFRIASNGLEPVPETSFVQEKLSERADLQRLLKSNIAILDPDLMVIAEEFGDWEDSSRRLDLLCFDRSDSTLTVVELKRTDDGGHMELQAVRYAAMVSNMTFERTVAAHARYLNVDVAEAEAAVMAFLGSDSSGDAELGEQVRIVLVSANFSREVTTAVLWLNKQGLDITCYRMRPYRLEGDVLVDIDQLIPLPEAADYETRLRAQRDESNRVAAGRKAIYQKFWGQLIDRSRSRTSVIANRTSSKDHWITGRGGRTGFSLNFVLNQHESQAECYITFGAKGVHRADAAYQALLLQKDAIEEQVGEKLVWEDLPGRQGAKISRPVVGGWRTAEEEWPALQERLIEAMVSIERALRGPIDALIIPD